MSDFGKTLATAILPPADSKGGQGMLVYAVDPNKPDAKPLIDAGGDVPHEAASLTKLMTFYVALDAIKDGKLDADKPITISRHAASQQYGKVRAGEKMPLGEAFGALMTASDNRVAVAISEAVGGDFVGKMNAKAKELGLDNTYFYNTNGLPVNGPAPKPKPGEKGPPELPPATDPHERHKRLITHQNITSAHDMAKLIAGLHHDYPDAAQDYMGLSSVAYGPRHKEFGAHHQLENPKSPLKLPDGYKVIAKTGLTDVAGFNIASVITAPSGKELTVVVLGADHEVDAERSRAAGVPDELLPKGNGKIKGSIVRDALVLNIAKNALGEGWLGLGHVTIAIPKPADPAHPDPQQAAPVSQTPPANHAAPGHPAHHHHTHHPAPKKTALDLSPDHAAMLAAASQQFHGAVTTGGTPSAPGAKPSDLTRAR